MNQQYDDFAFTEIRAMVDRRYQRRMRVIRRFFIGLLASVIPFSFYIIYADLMQQRLENGWSTYEDFMSAYTVGSYITLLMSVAIVMWFLIALFDLFIGGAKDRALRQEIDREREWRLREWQAQAFAQSQAPFRDNAYPQSGAYEIDDDGEIAYRAKRKRIEE
jgi:preprotein translocase subunit SecG